MANRVWIWLAAACALGCGGQTEEDSRGSITTLAGDGGSSPSSEAGFTVVPLGTCAAPGFLQTEAYGRPCNWLGTDDRCYDTREAACACLCPRDVTSQCVSGFYEGENSATGIGCQ
jgi:hypothetical protein